MVPANVVAVALNGRGPWVSGPSGWFALLLGVVTACTFYTERPAEEQCAPTTGGTSSQGGSGGGTPRGGSGGSAGDAGSGDAGQENAGGGAGDDGKDTGEWVDATGDLTGRSTGGGNVVYVSAKPDEDLLIAGVLGSGWLTGRPGSEACIRIDWRGARAGALLVLVLQPARHEASAAKSKA